MWNIFSLTQNASTSGDIDTENLAIPNDNDGLNGDIKNAKELRNEDQDWVFV